MSNPQQENQRLTHLADEAMFVKSCSAEDRVLDGPTNKVCQNAACLLGSKGQGKLLTPASYRLMQTANLGNPAGLDWGAGFGRRAPKVGAFVHQGADGNWLAIVVLFLEQGTGALAVAKSGTHMGAEKGLNTVLGTLFPTLSPAKKAS